MFSFKCRKRTVTPPGPDRGLLVERKRPLRRELFVSPVPSITRPVKLAVGPMGFVARLTTTVNRSTPNYNRPECCTYPGQGQALGHGREQPQLNASRGSSFYNPGVPQYPNSTESTATAYPQKPKPPGPVRTPFQSIPEVRQVTAQDIGAMKSWKTRPCTIIQDAGELQFNTRYALPTHR